MKIIIIIIINNNIMKLINKKRRERGERFNLRFGNDINPNISKEVAPYTFSWLQFRCYIKNLFCCLDYRKPFC